MSADSTLDSNTRRFRGIKSIGGSYITVAVFAAEVIALPILLLGFLGIQANAHLQTEQLEATGLWALILICLGDIALLILMSYLTADARIRLDRWAQGKSLPGGKAESDAWTEIISVWWRYGASVVGVFQLVLLGLAAAQFYGLDASPDQIAFTYMGGTAASVAIVLITTPILEILLRPALTILRPETPPADEYRIPLLGLEVKFQSILVGMVVINILLLAPIGFEAMTQALTRTIDASQLYQDLRFNLFGTIMAVIFLGIILSFLLARQIFRPIRQISTTLAQVEKGNLQQRLDIADFTMFPATSTLAVSFNQMAAQLEVMQQTLEKRITDSNELLRASNDVGKIASTILDPDALVTQAVNLIANTFSYYFVAIFLVVDDRRAALKDATGTAGEVLKENRHSVLISDNNMVGASIIKKEPQIALDVGEGAKIVYNPLLSFTRSELALPLIVGERVIGSLDVQSTREADFNSDNIATLQGMANQVAIAIENARLFAQMDQTLEELRQANRQYVVSSWTDKLQGQAMEFSTNSLAPSNSEESQEVVIGLNLRDQSIGQIRLQTDEEWTPEDQNWVESLATQVAISLENARLIEESQGSALRERLSASIVQKIWASTTSIDTILQTAVRELGRALEASETTIELQVDEKSK